VNDSLPDLIRLACQAEVLARKPGNVHPQAAFHDLSADDFLASAEVVGAPLAAAATSGVGRAVYEAVRATRSRVATNTNLGICLLIAPCAAAAVRATEPFRDALHQVLQGLTVEDASWAYRAIRVVQPGGLGRADAEDVSSEPTVTLLQAMQLAADRDGVARQYATRFSDLFEIGLPAVSEFAPLGVEQAIIGAQLRLMSVRPDTLIARKCGPVTAQESADQAARVLASGWPETGSDEFAEFDHWLRSDGHRRNPGTTADLIAATLFIALHTGTLARDRVASWIDSQQI